MFSTACFQVSALFAESSEFPKGTAIAMMLFFGAVGLISTVGLFASKETLESMSGIIGTKNPLVARIACVLGVLVGIIAVLVSVLAFLGVVK